MLKVATAAPAGSSVQLVRPHRVLERYHRLLAGVSGERLPHVCRKMWCVSVWGYGRVVTPYQKTISLHNVDKKQVLSEDGMLQ